MSRSRDLADSATGATSVAAGAVGTAAIIDVNVTQAKIADQAINEAKMQVSNAPTNGYMLTAQSGDTGGLTWAAAPTSSTTAGAVGTYMFGKESTLALNFGGTVAGSLLLATNGAASTTGQTAQTGTWRCMGKSDAAATTTSITVFVRIA